MPKSARSIKLTKTQQIIFNKMQGVHGPFRSAEDIYDESFSNPHSSLNMSLGQIKRTLTQLYRLKLIQKQDTFTLSGKGHVKRQWDITINREDEDTE